MDKDTAMQELDALMEERGTDAGVRVMMRHKLATCADYMAGPTLRSITRKLKGGARPLRSEDDKRATIEDVG